MTKSQNRSYLKIGLIIDFICPWCYIGLSRLLRVKQLLCEEVNIEIILEPFSLYPSLPIEGAEISDSIVPSKPGTGKSIRFEAEVEGIDFNFHRIKKIPNTLPAHAFVAGINDQQENFNLLKKYLRHISKMEWI